LPEGIDAQIRTSATVKPKLERLGVWWVPDPRFSPRSSFPKCVVWMGIKDDYDSSVIVYRTSVKDGAEDVVRHIASLPGDLQYALLNHAVEQVDQSWPRQAA
jgi:hypothetical protein